MILVYQLVKSSNLPILSQEFSSFDYVPPLQETLDSDILKFIWYRLLVFIQVAALVLVSKISFLFDLFFRVLFQVTQVDSQL